MALFVLLTVPAFVWRGANSASPADILNWIGDHRYVTIAGPGIDHAMWRLGDASRAIAQCSNPYTVRPGDTLYSIAARCNVSAASIKQVNRLKSDRVWINQRLVIPAPPAKPPGSRPPPLHPTPQP